MPVAETQSLQADCLEVARKAKAAAAELAQVSGAQKNNWLVQSARTLRDRSEEIRAANENDALILKSKRHPPSGYFP